MVLLIESATADDVVEFATEQDVHFVRLQFTDISGIPKNVEVPVRMLPAVLRDGIAFDGSSIEGFARIYESDMYLQPDPATFVIYPWKEDVTEGPLAPISNGYRRTARIICDVRTPGGESFAGDPRYALRRAVDRAADLGFTACAGPEPEFFLLRKGSDGDVTLNTHDYGGYFDLAPLDLGEEVRKDIVLALDSMGFNVEAAHHEVAPAQHEINFRYSDILDTADKIVTFKLVTKTVAGFRDLHATFMPKPIVGQSGSGMHLHLSLFRDGVNAFYDPDQPYNLSSLARHFLGGLVRHIGAITALANPTVNSYKRLVPGYEAPVNISWARHNRSALIRVPSSATPATSTRLEFRSPDPSCNPYLAFAAILQSGLDGIRREIEPPEPVEEDIYSMTREELSSRSIDVLPRSLDEALDALQEDEVVAESVGSHILERFLAARRTETADARLEVTPWEVDRYLHSL